MFNKSIIWLSHFRTVNHSLLFCWRWTQFFLVCRSNELMISLVPILLPLKCKARGRGTISSRSSVARKWVSPVFLIDIRFSSPSIRSIKYTVHGSSAVTLRWWNRPIPLTARNWLDRNFPRFFTSKHRFERVVPFHLQLLICWSRCETGQENQHLTFGKVSECG